MTERVTIARFALFAPDAMLDAKGCDSWHDPYVTYVSCRGCSITRELQTAVLDGDVDITIMDGLHPEFGSGRSYTGRYRSERGQAAITRMIAWLHGHPEPIVKAPSSMSPGVDTPRSDD